MTALTMTALTTGADDGADVDRVAETDPDDAEDDTDDAAEDATSDDALIVGTGAPPVSRSWSPAIRGPRVPRVHRGPGLRRTSLLVVDNGSVDDPTARVADVLPSAFVRRLPRGPGFAAAIHQTRPWCRSGSPVPAVRTTTSACVPAR